jgi:hypothetical protein
MIKRQRENLAKYCYDISKIMVAVPVIGNIMSDRFSLLVFWAGIIGADIFLILGHFLDKGGDNDSK